MSDHTSTPDRIAAPWARIRVPVPFPDEEPLEEALLELDDDTFAELIRDQVVAHDDRPGGRQQWSRLWAILGSDDDLGQRAADVLEDFLDTTETALAGELPEADRRRAKKFVLLCNGSLDRLDRIDLDDGPLAWAGSAGSRHAPAARHVIAHLVAAIATHRTRTGGQATEADQELWDVLRRENLDPDDYSTRRRRR